MPASWPPIPYAPWRETCAALQLYTQIVGKYGLARTPWVNHSWHATLYVTARGLTTSLVPDGSGGIEIAFDLVDHALTGAASDGSTARFALGPMTVAAFHARFLELVRALGGTPKLHGTPNEVPDPVPFARDHAPRPYDAVRGARDPVAALTAFLESTYRAAADLGGWDRRNLECRPGEPLRPRPLDGGAN